MFNFNNIIIPILCESIKNPFTLKQSESVKRLKNLTKYSTFYELLDLSISCKKADIEKAYREKLMDKTFLSELKTIDKRNLLGDAVNSLLKNRSTYDKELSQVDLLNFGIPKPIAIIFLCLFLFAFILIIDFSIVFLKHKQFIENTKNLNKKEMKKVTASDLEFNWRNMYFYKLVFSNKKKKYD